MTNARRKRSEAFVLHGNFAFIKRQTNTATAVRDEGKTDKLSDKNGGRTEGVEGEKRVEISGRKSTPCARLHRWKDGHNDEESWQLKITALSNGLTNCACAR